MKPDMKQEQYIRSMNLQRNKVPSFDKYPFNIGVIRNLETIDFHPKVTFIIGENGSGKSTLLEAIATAWGFNPEGGTVNFNFSTQSSHSTLHNYIRLIKGTKRPEDGFFLRAESFYNVASNIDELDKPIECSLIQPPPLINSYGGLSLHKQSHGEAFFSLMLNKFTGNSLYILDEPESALSPTRQMAMLTLIKKLSTKNSQFIISTHSPILMAYPEAAIYQIENGQLIIKEYEKTDHFQVTRNFLNNTQVFLKELFHD